jgi:hypothetical protein
MEKGDPEWLDWTCKVLEFEVIKAYVAVINPAIKVKCLRAGQRSSPSEPACQWEFKLGQ